MAQPEFGSEHFIKEEELAEPIELYSFEMPPRPSIELKPLPRGLKYVFLNNNLETPIIDLPYSACIYLLSTTKFFVSKLKFLLGPS